MKRFIKRITSVGLAAVVFTGSMISSSASGETIILTQAPIKEYNVLADTNAEKAASTTITLDQTAVTYDENGTGGIVTVTTTGGAAGAQVAVKSENAEIVTAEYLAGRIFLTPKEAGSVDVTVTYGEAKAILNVTVKQTSTPTAKAFNFYSDKEKRYVSSSFGGIWVNGGNVTMPDKSKANFKDLTVYTDFEPVLVDPKPDDAKVESKAGKALIGITAVDVNTVPYADNKLTSDPEASKVVKASYKSGEIKVTAGSESGTVRVWLMDVAADGKLANYNSFVVNVKAAASNIMVTDSEGATVKAVGLAAGRSVTYNLKGYLKDKKTEATDSTYSVTVDNKYTENVAIDYNASRGTIKITGVKTNGGKAVKTKVTVMCNQSGKKATISVTVTNPTSNIRATIAEGENSYLHWKGDTTKLNIVETTSEGMGNTSDKVKVYVTDDSVSPLTIDEKGKIKCTKSKAAAGTYKNGVLTLKRNDPTVAGTVYLVYTDAATKTSKAFKVCEIAAIVISEGGVRLA